MVFGEYNYDEDIAVQREEAAEEAWGKAWGKAWDESRFRDRIDYSVRKLRKGMSEADLFLDLKESFDIDEETARKIIDTALIEK